MVGAVEAYHGIKFRDSSVVEQRLDKPLVASSNLALGTKFLVMFLHIIYTRYIPR